MGPDAFCILLVFKRKENSPFWLTLVHLSLSSLLFGIPLGKAVSLPSAGDDLFPPIRPPADVTAPQADDAEEGVVAVDAAIHPKRATGELFCREIIISPLL